MANPPKPIALHIVNGNPSQLSAKELKARLAAEPKCLEECRDPPEWLTDEQKASWDHALKHAPVGLLKAIDRTVLIQWTIAECEYFRAARLVTTQPQLYRDAKKEVRRNPIIFVMRAWSEELTRLGQLLGFNPMSRARIGVATLGGKDELPGDPWQELASM